MDCKILLSLLQEGKPSKIASKLGFLAQGLEKWTKVVQARILVKNGRRSTPVVHPDHLISTQWTQCRGSNTLFHEMELQHAHFILYTTHFTLYTAQGDESNTLFHHTPR